MGVGERVAMNLGDAHELAHHYRAAARELGYASSVLAPLVGRAGELVGAVSSAPFELEGLAIELAYDGDDVAWRADYLEAYDRAFDVGGRRVGMLPESRAEPPRFSAGELAAQLSGLITANPILNQTNFDALMAGLAGYVRHDRGDPEWHEIVEYWQDDLIDDDPDLASELAEMLDYLWSLDPAALATIDSLVSELAGQEHDPAYLVDVFQTLGPRDTLQLTETISTLAYADALRSTGDDMFSSIDLFGLRDRLAGSLAVASRMEVSARHHGMAPALSGRWFDELFETGVIRRDRLFGSDDIVLFDGLPALFAAGAFRPDIAVRAGQLGLEVFDHRVRVERGWASPLFDGFDRLETNWEDRGGMLLSAATRVPEAAAAILLSEASSGRTGADIVTDRSFDNMNRDVVAGHYAELITSGLITAEVAALADGVDVVALHDPWHARVAVIRSIAAQTRSNTDEDPYPFELNAAFTAVTVNMMGHFMRAEHHGDDPVDLSPTATAVPSPEASIFVDPETMKFLLGTLFRHPDHREMITVAAATEQRYAFYDNPSNVTLNRAGALDGAITNGFNVAGIDNAHQIVAEIEHANAIVDRIVDGGRFALELAPKGDLVVEAIRKSDDVLNLAGVDVVEDYIHGDTEGIVETAVIDAQSTIYETDPNGHLYVFGLAFERMQAEFDHGGYDALSDTSRIIFERMNAEPDLQRVFVAGETSLGDLRRIGGEIWNEYDSAAWTLTIEIPQLADQLDSFRRGRSEAHLDLAAASG